MPHSQGARWSVRAGGYLGWIVLLLLAPNTQAFPDSWAYDWSARIDRDSRAAGIYATTPFPIDENSTNYQISTDEGVKTYSLGVKYFVDGLSGNNTNAGTTLTAPKKTISAAITAAGSGNVTIIVRGEHGGFDGRYNEQINLRSGLDDQRRWMIVGYRQERPIIVLASTTASSVEAPYSISFATVQRFRIEQNYQNGVRTGPDDSYISCIDLWLYANCRYDTTTAGTHADGNLYYLGSDNCWILHCTSERTYGHGYKVGDGADNCVVEWSIARDIGYWPGISPTAYWGNHCVAFDFPSDNTPASDPNDNVVLRYNIAETTLYGGVQLRHCPGFSAHHNEFVDGTHMDNISDSASHSITVTGNVTIHETTTSGRFYSNVIRGGSDAASIGIGLGSLADGNKILIYDNVISGYYRGAYLRGFSDVAASRSVSFCNNSVYGNSSAAQVYGSSGWNAGELQVLNCIVYQKGTGPCVDLDPDVLRGGSVYWAPGGSLGVTPRSDERNGNPGWSVVGPSAVADFYISADSPALGIGILQPSFADDIRGYLRGESWDAGAVEYGGSVLPGAPRNLRLK
jgi:hypothetical protein